MRFRHHGHHGLTAIELIAVVVILGLVAAMAMPRLDDISHEARSGALSGVAGAAASAMAVNYAACVMNGQAVGGSCHPVRDCEDIGGLMQASLGSGLPPGYRVTPSRLGPGAPGSNGVEGGCTLTQTVGDGRSASFVGISAGL